MARPRPRPLRPPSAGRVHRRERLFRLLDRARSRRIVWIEAPPGSGKTTLLASWVRARRLRALWYAHACGDDVARFFRVLAAGGGALRPASNLPEFHPAHLAAIRAYARRFFEALTAGPRAPAVLVLDDHHAVGSDSLLHVAVAAGVEAMSPRASVVVASRTAPPPAFARLRAAGELAELPGHALALTRGEAREVARLRGGRALPDEVLALCGGWAAGVVLLAAAHAQRASLQLAREHVFDYLAAEVFDNIEPRAREVLLRTCLLAQVDEAAAVRLSGIPEAGQALATLAGAGWLVERSALRPVTYRVHALLREFLIGRLREALGAAPYREQVRATSELALEAGDVDAAATLLVAEHEWERLARVLVDHGPALAEAGRLEALSCWLEALPAAHRASPWLRFWRGVSAFPRDPRGALSLLEEAFEAFAGTGDARGAWRSWAAAVELRICALDDLAPLSRLLDALPELRARLPPPDRATQAAVVASALTAYGNARATDPAAREWEERAFALAVSPGDPVGRLRVGCQLAIRYALWGTNLVRAQVVLEALRPFACSGAADPLHAIIWHAGAASYHAHRGDAAASLDAADRGLALAASSGLHVWDVLLRCLRIAGALAAEDLQTAAREVSAAASLVGRGAGRLATCWYQYMAAAVALRRGAVGEAVERARVATQLGADAGCALAASSAMVVWAAGAARGGGPGPALDEAVKAARIAGNGPAALGAALHRAHAALDRDELQAERLLGDALAQARHLGMMNVATLSRAELADLCAVALDRGVEAIFAHAIIRARGLAPGPRADGLAAWPWAVRVGALGGLCVHSGGPAEVCKAHRKPLELLSLLVAHGQHGAPLDRLAESLWPDADGDTARHALETTIYRLRRLLGTPASVVRRDGIAALDAGHVFVDAWAFEALATRAEAKRSAGRLAEAARVSAAARRLYEGELLPGDDLPPIASARERLRARAERLVRLDA